MANEQSHNDPLEKLVKKRFENESVPPSADAWSKIATATDTKPPISKLTYLLGASILTNLILGIVIILMYKVGYRVSHSTPIPKKQQQIENVITNQKKKDIIIEDTPSIEQSIPSNLPHRSKAKKVITSDKPDLNDTKQSIVFKENDPLEVDSNSYILPDSIITTSPTPVTIIVPDSLKEKPIRHTDLESFLKKHGKKLKLKDGEIFIED